MNQQQMSERNKLGWNQNAYEAWVSRHGTPSEYAEKLKEAPNRKIDYYLNELGDVTNKRILNLLGSKGNKAVCFALAGADVSVVDLSLENKRYAMELAKAAGVSITYVVKDVLEIEVDDFSPFDVVILEIGVLHYFTDLLPLFELIQQLLNENGIFIIREYHPFVTKVLRYTNGSAIPDGDYFSELYIEVDVAYSKLLPEQSQAELEKNVIRQWTISEVVNALINAGLVIRKMNEDKGIQWSFPDDAPKDISERIPGTFMICSSV